MSQTAELLDLSVYDSDALTRSGIRRAMHRTGLASCARHSCQHRVSRLPYSRPPQPCHDLPPGALWSRGCPSRSTRNHAVGTGADCTPPHVFTLILTSATHNAGLWRPRPPAPSWRIFLLALVPGSVLGKALRGWKAFWCWRRWRSSGRCSSSPAIP